MKESKGIARNMARKIEKFSSGTATAYPVL